MCLPNSVWNANVFETSLWALKNYYTAHIVVNGTIILHTSGTHLLKHPRTSLNHLHACKKSRESFISTVIHFHTQTHINLLALSHYHMYCIQTNHWGKAKFQCQIKTSQEMRGSALPTAVKPTKKAKKGSVIPWAVHQKMITFLSYFPFATILSCSLPSLLHSSSLVLYPAAFFYSI